VDQRIAVGEQLYDEIVPGLYVGPAPRVVGLAADAFDAVLDCRHDASDADRYTAVGIAYARLPFPDGVDLPADFDGRLDRALAWVDAQVRAGRRTLIHCHAGVSRSPFVAAAYVLPRVGNDPDAALSLVRRRRSAANPAQVFVTFLQRRTGRSYAAADSTFARLLAEETDGDEAPGGASNGVGTAHGGPDTDTAYSSFWMRT
jgi:protein-tyrosine phosphatase